MSGERPRLRRLGDYPPSWIDRLIDRIDALPGPSWGPYLVAFLVIVAVTNGAAWIDGYMTFGTFDPFLTSIAVYIVVPFAGIRYLDDMAARAWRTFRPAAAIDDAAAASVAYELVTMPALPTALWTLASIGLVAVYSVDLYGRPFDLEAEPVTLVTIVVLNMVSFAGSVGYIYHALRQLRQVGRFHAYIERVDLLHLEPLHAFSPVTAATGIVLLAIVWVSILTDPQTFTSPSLFVPLPFMIVLAVACFVIPLYGMHGRIAAEKARRLAAVNRRLDAAMRDLDRRADAHDLTEADAFNKHLASLITQRDVIARTPTWPWQPETIRGFVTAIALPIALWLVFRLLERQLG